MSYLHRMSIRLIFKPALYFVLGEFTYILQRHLIVPVPIRRQLAAYTAVGPRGKASGFSEGLRESHLTQIGAGFSRGMRRT